MNLTKKTSNVILNFCLFLLILLWVYAPVSKLLQFDHFRLQMERQHFSPGLTQILIWALPAAELLVAAALALEQSRLLGFYLSALLLLCFSTYIVLVLLHVFGKVPCSCGGVISKLGWSGHLVFNLFFVLLSYSGIQVINRERSMNGN